MNKKIISMLSGLIIFILASVTFVMAAIPEGPSTFTQAYEGRRQTYPAPTTEAYAGNITHLVINAQTVTQSWQGYVGNITGTITLDDSENYTLYDWSLGDPEGEIYATAATSVSWTTGNVICWNWSDLLGSELQLGELEGYDTTYEGTEEPTDNSELGLASDDVDGINETFTCDDCNGNSVTNTHTDFYVGGQFVNGSDTTPSSDGANGPCPYTYLYNGSHTAGLHEEVLLYEDTQNEVIYTSIIELSKNGYDNNTWDFEMIVGENGHDGDTATTTYYFYVELE